jgi:transposase
MNYCGIDLASKASAYCIEDGKGKHLNEDTFPTDEDGFRQALGRRSKMRCVVEASPLAEWSARTLEKLGHEVVVIDTRHAKALIATKKKTDKMDARNLAKMSRTGWYTEVHRKSDEARLKRSRAKAREGLTRAYLSYSSQIRGILRAHGIRVGAISKAEFQEHVLKLIAKNAPELESFILPLLSGREHAIKEADKIKKEITAQSKKDPICKLLMSTPGVGPLVSSAFISTIDDPTRFHRSTYVSAYIGLTPRVYQSGETEYRGRISREGDHMLRVLLVEAATVLLSRANRDFPLKIWGLKLKKKVGIAKARVAVARKLAVLLHRLWVTGKPFDYNYVGV